MTPTPVAKKLIPVASGTTIAIGFNAVAGGGAYTPVAGDGLAVWVAGQKATSGLPTIPAQTGWVFATGSPLGQANGGVSGMGAWLVRIADGTGTDTAAFTGLTSTPWTAECYAFAAGAFDPTTFPWDATAPVGATSNAANTGGSGITTRAANELVLTGIAIRGPAGTSALSWGGGSTVDQALAGSSNCFMSTATQAVPTGGTTVTPSATWTGGSGTASVLGSIAIAPPGSTPTSTQLKVRVAGSETLASPKVLAGGSEVVAAPKVFVGGTPV